MDSLNFCASIVMRKMKRTFTYNNTPVLTLSILYPKVTLCYCPYAQDSINFQIQAQVCDFLHYVSGELYQQAVATYYESQENEFPFRLYEAVLQYEITYNQHCHLSLYRDQYVYNGRRSRRNHQDGRYLGPHERLQHTAVMFLPS